MEFDAFAVEIGKLSLTLADVPHGNTWAIDAGDMFKPGVLRDAAVPSQAFPLSGSEPDGAFIQQDKAAMALVEGVLIGPRDVEPTSRGLLLHRRIGTQVLDLRQHVQL